MVDHPSHVTRFSDSSFYDEICVLCGTTDGPGGLLEASCPIGKNLKKSHTFEVLYYPERTARKIIRCKTCGETSLDMFAAFECTNPSEEKRAHLFEDVDVMRKIEGNDGREGPSWMDEMAREEIPVTVGVDLAADPEDRGTVKNAEYARGGVVTSVRPDRPAILDRVIDGCAAGVEPLMDGYNRDIKTVAQLTDVINTILLTRADPKTLHSQINAIRTVLLNISTPTVNVINIDASELSLTEKIGKVIYEEAKKIDLRTPVRHTPRDFQKMDEAYLPKMAQLEEAAKLELNRAKAALSADGKPPQHGTKLPDADFVPLYRSEKDA